MKKILTRNTLEEILDAAGLEAEDVVYNWPSGMYAGYGGHRSFALSTEDMSVAFEFFQGLGNLISYATHSQDKRTFPEGFANLETMAARAEVDPIGTGVVVYFRGWELEPEDGGE